MAYTRNINAERYNIGKDIFLDRFNYGYYLINIGVKRIYQ